MNYLKQNNSYEYNKNQNTNSNSHLNIFAAKCCFALCIFSHHISLNTYFSPVILFIKRTISCTFDLNTFQTYFSFFRNFTVSVTQSIRTCSFFSTCLVFFLLFFLCLCQSSERKELTHLLSYILNYNVEFCQLIDGCSNVLYSSSVSCIRVGRVFKILFVS